MMPDYNQQVEDFLFDSFKPEVIERRRREAQVALDAAPTLNPDHRCMALRDALYSGQVIATQLLVHLDVHPHLRIIKFELKNDRGKWVSISKCPFCGIALFL